MTNELPAEAIPTVLSHLFPMDSLREANRAVLVRSARFFKAKRGEVLLHQGERSEGVYYLIQGRVKLCIGSSQGCEKVVEIVREQSCFGEALMFSDKPSPITATVTAEAHLIHLRREGIMHVIQEEPAFALRLLHGMAGCFHNVMRDIEACSLRNSTQRVAGFLINEADRGASGPMEGQCSVRLPASKSVIASHLSITPETLSRSLSELKGAGLITVNSSVVEIREMAGLRSYVGG